MSLLFEATKFFWYSFNSLSIGGLNTLFSTDCRMQNQYGNNARGVNGVVNCLQKLTEIQKYFCELKSAHANIKIIELDDDQSAILVTFNQNGQKSGIGFSLEWESNILIGIVFLRHIADPDSFATTMYHRKHIFVTENILAREVPILRNRIKINIVGVILSSKEISIIESNTELNTIAEEVLDEGVEDDSYIFLSHPDGDNEKNIDNVSTESSIAIPSLYQSHALQELERKKREEEEKGNDDVDNTGVGHEGGYMAWDDHALEVCCEGDDEGEGGGDGEDGEDGEDVDGTNELATVNISPNTTPTASMGNNVSIDNDEDIGFMSWDRNAQEVCREVIVASPSPMTLTNTATEDDSLGYKSWDTNAGEVCEEDVNGGKLKSILPSSDMTQTKSSITSNTSSITMTAAKEVSLKKKVDFLSSVDVVLIPVIRKDMFDEQLFYSSHDLRSFGSESKEETALVQYKYGMTMRQAHNFLYQNGYESLMTDTTDNDSSSLLTEVPLEGFLKKREDTCNPHPPYNWKWTVLIFVLDFKTKELKWFHTQNVSDDDDGINSTSAISAPVPIATISVAGAEIITAIDSKAGGSQPNCFELRYKVEGVGPNDTRVQPHNSLYLAGRTEEDFTKWIHAFSKCTEISSRASTLSMDEDIDIDRLSMERRYALSKTDLRTSELQELNLNETWRPGKYLNQFINTINSDDAQKQEDKVSHIDKDAQVPLPAPSTAKTPNSKQNKSAAIVSRRIHRNSFPRVCLGCELLPPYFVKRPMKVPMEIHITVVACNNLKSPLKRVIPRPVHAMVEIRIQDEKANTEIQYDSTNPQFDLSSVYEFEINGEDAYDKYIEFKVIDKGKGLTQKSSNVIGLARVAICAIRCHINHSNPTSIILPIQHDFSPTIGKGFFNSDNYHLVDSTSSINTPQILRNKRAPTISISISKVDKSMNWMLEELRLRDEDMDAKHPELWI